MSKISWNQRFQKGFNTHWDGNRNLKEVLSVRHDQRCFAAISAQPNLPKLTMLRWWLYHVSVLIPVTENLRIFDTFSNQDLRDAVRRWNTDAKSHLTLRYGHIHEWNVSQITNMSELFRGMKHFNENISNWDVSNVKDMSFMFFGATSFNMPLWGSNTRLRSRHVLSCGFRLH